MSSQTLPASRPSTGLYPICQSLSHFRALNWTQHTMSGIASAELRSTTAKAAPQLPGQVHQGVL